MSLCQFQLQTTCSVKGVVRGPFLFKSGTRVCMYYVCKDGWMDR